MIRHDALFSDPDANSKLGDINPRAWWFKDNEEKTVWEVTDKIEALEMILRWREEDD